MRFAPTDDQLALRDAVRALLAAECSPAVIRAAWDSPTGLNPALWTRLAEMGVLGVLVPEHLGGLGMTFDEMVLVVEEAGYAGLPDPLIDHAVVALPLAAALGLDEVAAAGAAGERLVLVAGLDGAGVVHGGSADVLLVVDGESVTVVDPVPSGAGTPVGDVLDRSRRLMAFSAPVGSEGRRFDAVGEPIRSARTRGVVASSAFLGGAARRCLDLTVAYVSQREQFGVPVGSFQALKHQLATALMELEFARPVVVRAAHSLTIGSPDAERDASMAKAMMSDAAHFVARACLQAHGAIGYTVEYDLHLWLKRIEALVRSWGSAAEHRRSLMAALSLNC